MNMKNQSGMFSVDKEMAAKINAANPPKEDKHEYPSPAELAEKKRQKRAELLKAMEDENNQQFNF